MEESASHTPVKLWQVVFTGVMAVGAFATEALTVNMFLQAQEVTKWPTAEGEILRSELIDRFEGARTFEADIEYEYAVAGKRYRSTSIRTRGAKGKRRFDISSLVERFPQAAVVTVYYHPDDPTQSYLEAGPDWINYLIIISPLVFGVGFGWAFHDYALGYFGLRRGTSGS